MTFLEKLKVIERLDQLIRLKATGSPIELSQKLGVSRSTVYEIIGVMRNMGAEIAYCTGNKSFYYCKEVLLGIGFVEPSKIRGGKYIFYSPNISDNLGFILRRNTYFRAIL